MANPHGGGGVLSGLLSGWRMGENDHRAKEQYESDKVRQVKADQRGDVQWSQGQEDRVRDIDWQGQERDQQRQHWTQNATVFNQGQEDRAHAIGRRPVLEAREDEAHTLGVEARRQQIAAGRQQMGFAAEDQANQRRARKREWDAVSLQEEMDKATRVVAPAFIRGNQTGDWSQLKDAWNNTMGAHGAKVDAIESGPGGKIGVLVNGKQRIFNSADELQGFIVDALDPSEAFATMAENRKALQRSALGGDRGAPAAIQETDAIFNRLRPEQGESESDRWMRAYALRSQKAGMSPQQAGAGFYQALMKEAGGGARAHEQAMAATQTFMQTFYGGEQSQGAPTQGASTAQPAAQGDSRGRVVRTGTLPDGRRVAQYEDGSTALIQ